MARTHSVGFLGVATATSFVAAFQISACALHPPRTAAEQAADDHLAATVMTALLADQDLYARHIDVDADGGLVRLSGYVWSAEELYEAKRVAATVRGVTRVDSELEMMVGGRGGAR